MLARRSPVSSSVPQSPTIGCSHDPPRDTLIFPSTSPFFLSFTFPNTFVPVARTQRRRSLVTETGALQTLVCVLSLIPICPRSLFVFLSLLLSIYTAVASPVFEK